MPARLHTWESSQIRDVPDETERTLKARAERAGKSLAAYLRDLLIDEAATPDQSGGITRYRAV
ncbi:hypothetical protein ACFQ07_23275 [Actinomadura adrarensis]|uniref:Antitoxin FitA-like ribbon-helix-helix domain-containing protein n=1 Tax=Actinomadura adrarensis TaxID=1819600 RepID=A0ABW3CMN0_9ACTN